MKEFIGHLESFRSIDHPSDLGALCQISGGNNDEGPDTMEYFIANADARDRLRLRDRTGFHFNARSARSRAITGLHHLPHIRKLPVS